MHRNFGDVGAGHVVTAKRGRFGDQSGRRVQFASWWRCGLIRSCRLQRCDRTWLHCTCCNSCSPSISGWYFISHFSILHVWAKLGDESASFPGHLGSRPFQTVNLTVVLCCICSVSVSSSIYIYIYIYICCTDHEFVWYLRFPRFLSIKIAGVWVWNLLIW